ncbi:hypothetical protein [Pseudomonas zhanjiangensis]|uniref:Uncharacterized protein n=1 Tax=Pseudomonas zhanjiangensis TaxID=3239015 RepID=A0ABV3YTF2_9PSED
MFSLTFPYNPTRTPCKFWTTILRSLLSGIALATLTIGLNNYSHATSNQVLYGISSNQNLYKIDIDTGTATFIGDLGFNQNAAVSLATIPANGNLLTFRRPTQFIEINQANANATVLSDTVNFGIDGLSFDSNGTLFGFSSLTDDLAKYDPSTGQKTLIGSIPSITFTGGLTFNSWNELFAIKESSSLIKINTSDSSITSIGDFTPRNTWLGIAFDEHDILYAVRREYTSTGIISELHTVDVANAQTQLIGQISGFVQSDDSIIRLAFASDANQDPTLLLNDLVTQVMMINTQKGISNSLDAKLSSALNALDDTNESNNAGAINALKAFINTVQAQSEKQLTIEEAEALTQSALQLIEILANP